MALEDFTNPEYGATIDGWVIDRLKSIGCDTAKSVLAIDRDELVKRTDLEEETVDAMIAAVKEELEINE